jgi:hypothetical protein
MHGPMDETHGRFLLSLTSACEQMRLTKQVDFVRRGHVEAGKNLGPIIRVPDNYILVCLTDKL